MAVRTKRLFGPLEPTLTGGIVFTGPAGETTIIKHLSVANVVAVSCNLRLRLNGTSQVFNILDQNVPSTSAIQLTGLFIVLQPGDVLRALSAPLGLDLTAYGTELEGVAD